MSVIKGIEGFSSAIQGIKPSIKPEPSSGVSGQSGSSFAEMFHKAVGEVDKLQSEADSKIEGLITRRGGVQPHDAMIALEKAEIAFNLMTSIKSKLVRAYEEVMRTQV